MFQVEHSRHTINLGYIKNIQQKILKLCSQSSRYLNNVEGHIDTSEVIYTAVPAS